MNKHEPCNDPCTDIEQVKSMYEQALDIITKPDVSALSWRKAVECRECAAEKMIKYGREYGDGVIA